MTRPARSTLTWDSAHGKRGGMVDRPGRTLLVTQAAWATLTGRKPLLDGVPPFTDEQEARAVLERLSTDPLSRGLALRALNAVDRHEARLAGVDPGPEPRGCLTPGH